MGEIIFINEDTVTQILNWDSTFEAVKKAMESVSKNSDGINFRSFTVLPNTNNVLLTMPGYLNDEKYGALGCKLVTAFPSNPSKKNPLPTVLANIALFDEDTGAMKAIIAGTEITTWRTAAASVVATKYLHERNVERKNNILAIFGSGVQARIHAIAFQHFFKFKEVRIWNHRPEGAQKLVDELNKNKTGKPVFVACADGKECAKDADVIVTATTAREPIVKLEWIKPGVHINAVGAGITHHSELDENIYKTSDVYIDHWDGARRELSGLNNIGVQFKGEIGALILGKIHFPDSDRISVFQSLGMAVEDCAMARLVYDIHTKTSS